MNAQSRLLEENFRRLRIPYRLVGGRSFFERREIKDLTAYITVLLNPSDDASLLRIINSPPRGIGATAVELALTFSAENKLSLFQALRDMAIIWPPAHGKRPTRSSHLQTRLKPRASAFKRPEWIARISFPHFWMNAVTSAT